MNLSYLLLILQFYESSENRNFTTDPNENLTEICSDYTLPDSNFLNLEIEKQEEPIDLSFKLKGNNFGSKNVVFNDTNRHLAQKRFYQNTFKQNKNIPHIPSKKSKPKNNFIISLPKNDIKNTQLYKKHETSNNKDCVIVNSQDSRIEKPEIYNSVKNDKDIMKILSQYKNEKRYDNSNFIFNTNPLSNKNMEKLNSNNLDNTMYERNDTVETKFLQNVSLSNYTIYNEKFQDNGVKNMNKSENSLNNNIKLYDLFELQVDNKNIDSALHLKNQMFNDTFEIKNNIESFKDVNIKNNRHLETKNVEIFVDSLQNNYHVIQNGNIITVNNMITKNGNKYYNIENWIELRTDILKNLENLKEILIGCAISNSGNLEIIIYEIKKIVKMLIIWESFIDQMPSESTIPDTSLYNELISLPLLIKKTKYGLILFPEIILYDSNICYSCTFKEKNLLSQNIIQKMLFEVFQIFMTKIQNINNVSDIITRGQYLKLEIIRQILREFFYFTFEPYFLEKFKLLYKNLLHLILSKNEKKFQNILMDFKITDYQKKHRSTPFNSFSYHFRFIFLFTNPINYIFYETDEQKTNTEKNNVLKSESERLSSARSNMEDFLTSLLLHKSLKKFLNDFQEKKEN